MKKRVLFLLLAACLVMSMVTACGNSAGTSTPTTVPAETPATAPTAVLTPVAKTVSSTPPATSSASDQATVVFTDDAGRKVTLPKNISRIAPSGSLAQIVLFALAPEKFTGIANAWSDDAKQYIGQEYQNLPVLGQFYGTANLSLEEIAKIGPQVIIDVGEAKSTIVEDMDKIQNQLGIPTIHITATTKTMPDTYRKLGKLLGKEKEAEVLAQYVDKVYNNTLDIMNKVGDSGKVKVLYCLGDKGINVIAKGSYHSEVIDLVSNNLAVIDNPSSKGTGNEVDMEQIIKWNPDVIFFAPQSVYAKVGQDPTWQQVNAIKNKRYYEVPSGPYNWMGSPPSVNRYIGLIWATQLLYPEVAKYDVYQEAVKYYELFYHSTLTEAQYKTLVANSLLAR